MKTITIDPPTTRRKFTNSWGKLDYLCKKVRYWLYARKQKSKAIHYLDRLERILEGLPENDSAIIREEGMALLCKLQGNIAESILHRRKEIHFMERLHREAKSESYDDATRTYMLQDRDLSALQERRAILISLTKKPSAQNKLGA